MIRAGSHSRALLGDDPKMDLDSKQRIMTQGLSYRKYGVGTHAHKHINKAETYNTQHIQCSL